jgi:hypothetical protein
MTANQAYHQLARLGIVEQRERQSRTGVNGVKRFWSVTSKGCMYGKNITSPANPRRLSRTSSKQNSLNWLACWITQGKGNHDEDNSPTSAACAFKNKALC